MLNIYLSHCILCFNLKFKIITKFLIQMYSLFMYMFYIIEVIFCLKISYIIVKLP